MIDLKGFFVYFASTHIEHLEQLFLSDTLIKCIFLSFLIEAIFTCPNLPCHKSIDSTI